MPKHSEFTPVDVFSEKIDFYELKANGTGKEYFACGYLSTPDIDLGNDMVTQNCLARMQQKIMGQNFNLKLGVEHTEMFTKNFNLIPVAKVIDSKLDSKGLWIKTKLNTVHPDFNLVWKSIEDGFLDGFSIEFKPVKFAEKIIDGNKIRVLDDIMLGGATFTGRAMNPECRLTDFFAKSKAYIQTMDQMLHSEGVPIQAPLRAVDKITEGKNMTDEKLENTSVTPDTTADVGSEPKNEETEQKDTVQGKISEDKTENTTPTEMKSMLEEMKNQTKVINELKSMNEKLVKALDIKSTIKESVKTAETEGKSFNDIKGSGKEEEIKNLNNKFESKTEDLDTKSLIQNAFGKPTF